MDLAALNGAAPSAARSALAACCAAGDWLTTMVDARPFPDRAAVARVAAAALADLSWDGVREALDAHPRIGDRMAGGGREAAWSAAEQSGMDGATDETRAALVSANRAYEERFGHVFLIFATGKSDADLLAAARSRLHHPEEVERAVVRAELAKIVQLRLSKLLA